MKEPAFAGIIVKDFAEFGPEWEGIIGKGRGLASPLPGKRMIADENASW